MHMAQQVRPRWVWGGTITTGAAIVIIGVANVAGSLIWQLVGAALVIVGAVTALFGGIMKDVHGSVVPGGLIHDPKVVTETDSRPRPSLWVSRGDVGSASLAGLVVVAGWLLVSPTVLGVPFEAGVRDASVRDGAVAIVLVLAVVLLHQHGPSLIATGLCAACGLLLIVVSLTGSFPDRAQWVNELVSGVVIVALAAATLLRPQRHHQSAT